MNNELSISEMEGHNGSELPAREEFLLVTLGKISVSQLPILAVGTDAGFVAVPVPLPTLPTLPIPTLPI